MPVALPRGFKDFLPDECNWKIELENRFRQLFRSWGYLEVSTPTLEFASVFGNDQGADETKKTDVYQFFDAQGQLLALRSDMTAPIARMAASRFQVEQKPLRLGYQANVFRYDDVQVGRQREFYQAGVELIGSCGPQADAEVIALAATGLASMGLQGLQFDVGQVQFCQSLLATCGCEELAQQIHRALATKDYVSLREHLRLGKLAQDVKSLLLQLPDMYGGAKMLDQVGRMAPNEAAQQSIDDLRQILSVLEAYSIQAPICFDLSMTKSLNYYTGMVFEGYAPDLGFTLCTGGRYDRLLRQFGADIPATGFALGLERLMLVLSRQGLRPTKEEQVLLVLPKDWSAACAFATQKRSLGVVVEMDLLGMDRNQGLAYAKTKGIDQVVEVDADATNYYCVD